MMPFKVVHFDMPRWVIAVLIGAPFFMGGLAAEAVTIGQDQNDVQCEAVKGLREDLVGVVKDGQKRSTVTITDAFNGRQRVRLLQNLNEQTAQTLAKIDDPKCP
jgi:hypothetical protein